MIGILYLIIHLLALCLPGWVIVRLVGFEKGKPLFILASAYIFYVLFASVSKWLNLPLNTFLALYIGSFTLLAVVALKFPARQNLAACHSDKRAWLTGLMVVVAGYSLYRLIVGPYTEIPADLYRHLEYARVQFEGIATGHLGSEHSLSALFKQQGGIWYSFYALITHLLNAEFTDTLSAAMFANSLVYLIAVYSFAWYLFGHFNLGSKARMAAAVFSCFFMAAQLGLNLFAYIRYYNFAPAILNMVIYFAAVVAVIELLKWQENKIKHFIFLALALPAAAIVHNQETLFVLIIGGLMLAWFAIQPKHITSTHSFISSQKRWPYWALVSLFIIGFIGLEAWTYTHEARPNHFFNKVLQLSEQGPIWNRVLFLNPSYQAFQVITLWGLLVYALFAFYWRRFIAHPFLFAGMLIPIFTVFNPLFVDWFLRTDGVHTLWRMLYIVPTHFVAGLLLVWLYQAFKSASTLWNKALSALAILALFALLLPLGGLNNNSRMTLAKTDKDEQYTYWQDMLDYLNQNDIRKTSILTDPVTGYVLSGMTKHKTYQYKFLKRGMRQINFDDYQAAPLKKYKDWLLIVNDRSGGFSETGEVSRHWPENVLNTSSFYSTPLRAHIANNPEQRFKKRWERDKITIYEIQ